jgi:hypothetical protein
MACTTGRGAAFRHAVTRWRGGDPERPGRTRHRQHHHTTDADADRLFVLARQQRDILDETGIRDREAARHAARSLRFTKLLDGMARLT